MKKIGISKNKILKVAGLAFTAALAISGIAGVDAQTAPNTTITINKLVRNVSLGQSDFFDLAGAVPGDLVEFRIQVQNTGNYAANNVVVNDVLPSNFVLVSGFTTNNLGTLASGAIVTSTITARVSDAVNFPYGQSTWTNTASATASNQASTNLPIIDTASVVVNRNPDPNVSVVMEGRNITTGSSFGKSLSAKINDRMEFRIRVANSNNTAINVRVIDNLPTSLKYVSNTLRIDGIGSVSGDLFNSHVILGDLASGQTKTITYEAIVDIYTQANTTLTNTATAFMNNASLKADGVQINIVPGSGSVAGASTELFMSNTAFNQTQNRDATTVTAQINDLIVYTLTAVNRANTSTNFTIEDDLSDVLKLSNLVDFNGAEFFLSANKLRWQNVLIQPGSQVQKTFSVRVRATSETDRVMTNIFGNQTNVSVAAVLGASTSRPKVAGTFVAPKTGPSMAIILILAFISSVAVIVWRQRKLGIAQRK